MRRRALTEADRQVWASYARYLDKRLGGVPVDPVAPTPEPSDIRKPTAPPPMPRAVPRGLAPIEIGTSPGGVDRSTWTRFRSGKLPSQRTLDLHGHTVQRAHVELHAFLTHAMADRLRCVEIITGRGSGESGGVLRREVPLWLNGPQLRPVVLAASHPHPANQGAIRLLLRRIR